VGRIGIRYIDPDCAEKAALHVAEIGRHSCIAALRRNSEHR